MRGHSRLQRSGFLFALFLSISNAQAAPNPLDYAEASRFLKVPLQLTREGKASFQKNLWDHELDSDGTELLSARKRKARAAIMKDKDGKTEALISYALNQKGKSERESSSALFFERGKLAAVTICEETEKSRDLGRVCVTATQGLCTDLRTGNGIDPKNLEQLEKYETRALASILTLRGPDHQIDNMIKTGNKMGLKSSLQTTRGQLITLARQIAKELGIKSSDSSPLKSKDEEVARAVLEFTLPLLKSSCTDARF